jgi:glycosyltransferase involved in cell wall biosynthesis
MQTVIPDLASSKRPSVSILVPAFNAGRFIDESLASAAGQTYVDWEVVAVNDASIDDTASKLEEWARREPKVRVFHNAANLGMTGNWNKCLSFARGEYVIKLDADDVLRPRTVELLVDRLRDLGVVGAAVRALLYSEAGEVIGAPPGDSALMNAGIDPYCDHSYPGARWMQIAAFGHQLWSSSAFLVRKDWLSATGGWDERFGCASDTELMLRMLRARGTFHHCSYVGIYYRIVGGSVSDVYRNSGWLAWEALAVYLRNLENLPEVLRTSRLARQRRVALWNQWVSRHHSVDWSERLPESMRAKLEDAMSDSFAPPMAHRVFASLRALGSRIPV